MKCTKMKKWISRYIDGDLEPDKVSSLEKHLETCPDCRKLVKDFQEITKKAKTLKKISPSEKSWFRIQTRLTDREERREPPVWGGEKRFLFFPAKLRYAVSTALLVLVVAGGVFIGLKYGIQGKAISRPNGQKYALAKLKQAEHHYRMAIKALGEALQAQKKRLDPQMAEIFQTNLELIDASIQACKQAVQGDPRDLESRKYLLAAYKKKAELLNSMMDVSINSLRKPSENVL